MRALRAVAPLALVALLAGCISGDFAGDAGVSLPRDLSAAVPLYDLYGVDLYGAYNCSALNACESKCTTTVCVFNCRKQATPSAVTKELALQDCFNSYCPKAVDMGTAICMANDMGAYSAACTSCINNTYVPASQSCSGSGSGSAPECHKCVAEASACSEDK